ncbi:MAG: DNA cytosine methyltransferase [Alphaproteobacteria bacterium]|nr:DNA cytosine methyltransferase [Alphaproteobacteria bacterium]
MKPRAIDLFSGCGGLSLGLKQAGFEIIAAVELDSVAAQTYEANHGLGVVRLKDIQRVSANGLRSELGLRPSELELLAGCPPCQGFSTLRTRNGAQRNRDRRNDLVGEMLRFAKAFLPKAVMMENVPGLLGRKPFIDLCKGLERLGYIVTYGIQDAADHGVPQRRRRLILLAGRGFEIPFARRSTRRATVREAISRIAKAGRSGDPLHDWPEKRSEKIVRLIKDIPKNGGSRLDLPRRRQLECHRKSDGFRDIYGRMAWDGVSPTITSGCFNPSKGRFLHPTENRAITMREAALLQSFPKSYKFILSAGKEAIALMIGNALPPELIRRQALKIIATVKSA